MQERGLESDEVAEASDHLVQAPLRHELLGRGLAGQRVEPRVLAFDRLEQLAGCLQEGLCNLWIEAATRPAPHRIDSSFAAARIMEHDRREGHISRSEGYT